jgi:hypothetical protein
VPPASPGLLLHSVLPREGATDKQQIPCHDVVSDDAATARNSATAIKGSSLSAFVAANMGDCRPPADEPHPLRHEGTLTSRSSARSDGQDRACSRKQPSRGCASLGNEDGAAVETRHVCMAARRSFPVQAKGHGNNNDDYNIIILLTRHRYGADDKHPWRRVEASTRTSTHRLHGTTLLAVGSDSSRPSFLPTAIAATNQVSRERSGTLRCCHA